ncbi:MAG: substrate-binding domain-containing protein [Acidimicrobiia bacterium]|nr:substrate-binding domain-containing protein [Acidimicrobiia bacterium]
MKHTTRRTTWLLAMLAAVSLIAAACGDDDGDAGANGNGQTSDLTGSVVVSGSSTVEPISVAVAEKFNADNPDVDVPVDGPGTGDGFELFCAGETAINDASSKVKDEQIAACEENGVEFIELWIGNDGLSIMTNEANEEMSCVSLADIYALIGPESQGFDNWSDAQDLADELGSETTFPDAPLAITGPGEESGTFSSFVEIVIEEFNEDRGADATTRPDYQSSGDDNVIIQGIQGSDTSLGWVGFAFAREAEGVKILEVDGGDGCVEPTDETVADGSYPIARPLFIYVNAAMADENPALAAFVDFYLNGGVESVGEVGYVPLADEDLEATRALWEGRTTGAQ